VRKACLYPSFASVALWASVRLLAAVGLLAAVALLPACTVLPSPETSAARWPPGSAAPRESAPQPPYPAVPAPGPLAPSRPAPFALGPASSALVAQAHAQTSAQDYALAAATIERALRIEPGNPLLWIELGRIRLREGNTAQAEGLGRKALALATGDPAAQSSAQRLIAQSQRGGTALVRP